MREYSKPSKTAECSCSRKIMSYAGVFPRAVPPTQGRCQHVCSPTMDHAVLSLSWPCAGPEIFLEANYFTPRRPTRDSKTCCCFGTVPSYCCRTVWIRIQLHPNFDCARDYVHVIMAPVGTRDWLLLSVGLLLHIFFSLIDLYYFIIHAVHIKLK